MTNEEILKKYKENKKIKNNLFNINKKYKMIGFSQSSQAENNNQLSLCVEKQSPSCIYPIKLIITREIFLPSRYYDNTKLMNRILSYPIEVKNLASPNYHTSRICSVVKTQANTPKETFRPWLSFATDAYYHNTKYIEHDLYHCIKETLEMFYKLDILRTKPPLLSDIFAYASTISEEIIQEYYLIGQAPPSQSS